MIFFPFFRFQSKSNQNEGSNAGHQRFEFENFSFLVAITGNEEIARRFHFSRFKQMMKYLTNKRYDSYTVPRLQLTYLVCFNLVNILFEKYKKEISQTMYDVRCTCVRVLSSAPCQIRKFYL